MSYRLLGGTVISNGTIRFPQSAEKDRDWHLGPMTVQAPGTLDVPANCNAVMMSLTGDGAIVNTKGAVTQLRPEGTSVFDGYLGRDGLRVYTKGDVTFTCLTNAIAFSEFSTWGGRISFPRFGNKGELSPAGPNATLKGRDSGGTIRYLGTGETTDRDFLFFHNAPEYICALDAGPTGGVTFRGIFDIGRAGEWNTLVLTGSNTVPMTVAGAVKEYAPIRIVKEGSGTWAFADTADNVRDRWQKGIYDVRDGVLAFDSIADIGCPCALGPQNLLVSPTNAFKDVSNTVDTAFLLGTTKGRTGTLRYEGTQSASTDRLIGVVGRGRIENASDAALEWNGGARATGAADMSSELVLAGDSAARNVISNLRDGTDGKPLNVTKEGAGTWSFMGGTTFSGTLNVMSGTLALAPPKGAFTWYKWTIRESSGGRQVRLGNATSVDANVGARQLTFYDVDGNPISAGQFTEDPNRDLATLQPGGMTYDGEVIRATYLTGNAATADGDTGRNLNRLIDELDTEWLVYPMTTPVRVDRPDSWFSVVFRFPEGAPTPAAYDVYSYGAAANNSRSVCAWTMYGSDDGINWHELDRRDVDAVAAGWVSDGSTVYTATGRVPAEGHSYALVDNEDTSVYGIPNARVVVASEATLSTGRDDLPLPLPSPLNVTQGGTVGRFAGFRVPSTGTVSVRVPLAWFRLTVMETTDGFNIRTKGEPSKDQNVQMHEFALYDGRGVRRNCGLRMDARNQPALLEPGFATYDRAGCNYYGNRDADKLFDDLVNGASSNGWCVTFGRSPRLDDATTWTSLTMRLADADPQIASYDWCSVLEPAHSRTVLSWRLEGSVDGERWIVLDERIDYTGRPAGSRWWSDQSAFVAGTVRAGFPVSGDAAEASVSFADFTCAIDLSSCTDTANLSKWDVTVNGVLVPRMRFRYDNGGLSAVIPACVILFR